MFTRITTTNLKILPHISNNLRTLTSSVFNIEKLKINNFEENIIKGGKDKYNLLHDGFKGINKIGIIGWGSQAPAQVQNLNDTLRYINSNIKIKVGLRKNSKSREKVLSTNGLDHTNLGTIDEVLEESDMNIILISDYAQSTNYKEIFNKIRPGTTLGFSHGFLLGHLKNEQKTFPDDINVVMMAPKGMGPSVRKLYLENTGINSSIAVHQDINGLALNHVLSWGIGVGSPYIFETSMEKEYISDIFGERAILLGGIYGIVEHLFNQHSQYLSYDKSFIIACKNLTSIINDKISKEGLIGVYNNLNNNEKLVFKEYYSKGYSSAYDLFNIIYREVESGNEIKSVINTNEYLIENKKTMSNIENSKMWKVGKKLYKNDFNDFRNKEFFAFDSYDVIKDDYFYMYNINPKTAGLYIGGMMAQIDILLEKGHSYSEIVNESVIEATDSLNPYMDEKGISYMIDNCSITARLGARKWGPQLKDYLENNSTNPLKQINKDLIKFKEHEIHGVIEKLYKFKN